jgi:hypothetical protein
MTTSVDAYISVFFSKEKACKFAVILDGGGEVFKRSYQTEDGKSLNYLSLLATLYTIGCLTKKDVNIKFRTTNKYIISMLEKDENGWLKAANANQDIIAEIRKKLGELTAFSVEYDKSSEHMTAAASMIR